MYNKQLNNKHMEIPLYFTGPGDSPSGPDSKNWTNVGKYIKQLYDEFQGLETTSELLIFLKYRITE